ncbi:MAG: archease [Candidatus Helarchaeales archaeon]
MKKIKELPHTADVKYEITGENLKEAFELAGYAFTNTHADILTVIPKHSITLEVSGEDLESLLFEFISELIYVLGTRSLLISLFQDLEITKNDGMYSLRVIAWGEEIDPSRHDLKTEVKGMTYHDMKIESLSEAGMYEGPVRIILLFDI